MKGFKFLENNEIGTFGMIISQLSISKVNISSLGVILSSALVMTIGTGYSQDTLSLNDVIDRAMTHHRVLSLKNSEEIQTQQTRIVRSQLLPNLSAGANMNEYVQDSRVAFRNDILPVSEVNNAKTMSANNSLNTSIDLTSFLQTFVQLKAQKYGREALELDNISELNAIILEVVKSYNDVRVGRQTLDFFSKQMKSSEQIAELSELRLKAGAIDSVEYYQAQVNFQNDLIAYRNAQVDLFDATNTLQLWTNIQGDFVLQPIETIVPNEQKTDQLHELLSLESKYKSSVASNRALLTNYLPSFNLFAGYGFSNQTFQNGIVSQNRAIGTSYGLAVSWNLGSVKQNWHQQKINRIQQSEMELILNKRREELKNQKSVLEKRVENAQLNFSAQKMATQMSNLALNKGMLQYEMGAISLTELRLLQNQELQAKLDLIQSQVDYEYMKLSLKSVCGTLRD